MVKRDGLVVRCGVGVWFVCVLALGVLCGREGNAGVGEWEATALSHVVEAGFDLRFSVTAATGGAVRLVFGEAGLEEGSYVELGAEGIFLGATSDGEELGRRLVSRVCLADLVERPLVYQRREHRWSLLAGERIIVGGDSPPAVGGRILFAACRERPVQVAQVRYRRIHGVYFADSFMRTEKDPTAWEEVSGYWRLNTMRNPLLSANAFYYSGGCRKSGAEEKPAAGGEEPPVLARAVALAGEQFWSDVAVGVACRPAAEGAVGVYLCYRGPEDYVLFRWSGNDTARPVRQLLQRAGWLRVSIDGERVFLVREAGIARGRIGLHVEGKGYASFDDVKVVSRPARYMGADATHAGGWVAIGGDWTQVAPADWNTADWGGGVVVSAPEAEPATLLWEDTGWRRMAVNARLGPWRKGSLGFVLRYADGRNYCCVRWRKASIPVIQVCRVIRGETEVLAERAMAEDGQAHRLGVVSEEGAIAVTVDGRQVLETSDFGLLSGRSGLYAEGVGGGSFSEVVSETLAKRQPLGERTAGAFSAEPAEMQTWAGAGSDWRAVRYSEGVPEPVLLWWHKAEFRGDTRLDMRLDGPLGAAEGAGLLLEGDGKDVLKGCMVRLRGDESAAGGGRAELVVDGKVAAERALVWAAGPRILSFRRVGRMVSAFLSDRLLFSLPVVSARAGDCIGWYAGNEEKTHGDVDVYSENLLNYSFQSAPTDWREGGGIWEVSNKWQCDPRWSFFSGRQLGGGAAIWFRRPLVGDFTLDCYIGNKMASERGNQYEYARDMNISFCADGHDLTSGYSFLFGGHNNARTSLYRQEKEWATDGKVINQRGLHRKWYHFQVTRRGGEITASVDGVPVFRKVDAEPLPGGYFAVWTYDNGIMLGRVRISADGIGPRDSAARVWPQTTQAIYGQ